MKLVQYFLKAILYTKEAILIEYVDENYVIFNFINKFNYEWKGIVIDNLTLKLYYISNKTNCSFVYNFEFARNGFSSASITKWEEEKFRNLIDDKLKK